MRGRGGVTLLAAALAVTVACGGTAAGSDRAASEPARPTTTTPPAVTSSAVTVPAPPPVALAPEQRAAVDAALAAGGAFEARHIDEVGASSMAFLEYLWRRWTVAGLEVVEGRSVGEPTDPSEALLVRLIDPGATYPERAMGSDGSYWEHEVLVPALFCDQVGVPPDYAARLASESRGGLAARSHVAYAITWTRELGCAVPGIDDVALVLAEMLSDDLETGAEVGDELLGVSAALGYLGRPDLVPQAWLTKVLDAQRPDGGWAEQPGGSSSWHSTGLALWTLAAATGPGATAEMLPTS